MKKIFRFSVIVSLCAALVSLTSCQKTKELDVDPLGESFSFNGMAPNPVMRGGALRIFGRSLDQVSEVRFAGDVTVTEFIKVSKGAKLDTLEVLVPLEGPVVGKVSLAAKDGRVLNSFSDLSFTEPIEVESFTPASVLSGDVITFKGEYLNDVKEVIFSGDNAVAIEFESQSRHELRVKVPANAVSGPVILSDVNEIEDENSIPNHIYTQTDLTVGNPTVVKAAKTVYKSGDVITVTGEHLDMIQTVDLPRASDVKFTYGREADWIIFNLPPEATDGNIILTSYAGVTFDAGEIETVNVRELTVVSLAEDQRFKAGCSVQISGTDLDLVTKVEFTGAEASWYMDGDKIVATQPDTAKDGPVTVTLDSGKKAYSEDLEVVKPEILAWAHLEEYVAGKTVVRVEGLDLDLVDNVVIGNKEQGFIPCEFEFFVEEGTSIIDVDVKLPEQAYTGPITFTSAAGYTTETEPIEVTYDMAVSIKFDEKSYGLGNNITVSGKNLMQIEQIFIKNKKVTNYVVRTDNAMSFGIPDGLGPGVYRLALVLVDGTELSWPVPFEITAPFTETFYWEGSEDLGSWSNQPYLGADGALAGNVVVGDILRVYYTPYASWWQFEIFGGHWDGQLAKVTADNTDPDATFYPIEITDDNIGTLTSSQGWGGVLVLQGESVIITGMSVIHFGAAEKRTTIWEGSSQVTWAGGAVTALSWGGYDWSTVEAGTKLSVAYTIDDPEGCIRFGNGSWASCPAWPAWLRTATCRWKATGIPSSSPTPTSMSW